MVSNNENEAKANMPDQHRAITIRLLEQKDADAYRSLRLEALATSPEAFGSSYEEEKLRSFDSFIDRVTPSNGNAVWGGFDKEIIVGMAGFAAEQALKTRHKSSLWGVFVRKENRGHGLAGRLVQTIIENAPKHILILRANVVTSNEKARAMYRRLGFTSYGVERNALLIKDTFYDEELLSLNLGNKSWS